MNKKMALVSLVIACLALTACGESDSKISSKQNLEQSDSKVLTDKEKKEKEKKFIDETLDLKF